MTENGQEWPRMTENDQEWPRMAENGRVSATLAAETQFDIPSSMLADHGQRDVQRRDAVGSVRHGSRADLPHVRGGKCEAQLDPIHADMSDGSTARRPSATPMLSRSTLSVAPTLRARKRHTDPRKCVFSFRSVPVRGLLPRGCNSTACLATRHSGARIPGLRSEVVGPKGLHPEDRLSGLRVCGADGVSTFCPVGTPMGTSDKVGCCLIKV